MMTLKIVRELSQPLGPNASLFLDTALLACIRIGTPLVKIAFLFNNTKSFGIQPTSTTYDILIQAARSNCTQFFPYAYPTL